MLKVIECCSKTSFPGTRKMVKTIKMIGMKWCLLGRIGAPLPRVGGQDYVSSNKLPHIIKPFSDISFFANLPNARKLEMAWASEDPQFLKMSSPQRQRRSATEV